MITEKRRKRIVSKKLNQYCSHIATALKQELRPPDSRRDFALIQTTRKHYSLDFEAFVDFDFVELPLGFVRFRLRPEHIGDDLAAAFPAEIRPRPRGLPRGISLQFVNIPLQLPNCCTINICISRKMLKACWNYVIGIQNGHRLHNIIPNGQT